MRIVSGTYGGRLLEAPKDRNIRPTSDKVRGAIFNALQSRAAVAEAKVLDVFCGSGALGLEALSQGAHSCMFIDDSRTSLDLAKRNVQSLDIKSKAQFMLKDATKLPQRVNAQLPSPANLIFIDPPYDKNLIAPTLKALSDGQWLDDGALLVIEAEKKFTLQRPQSYDVMSEKIYGDTKIILARTLIPTC